MMSNYNNFSEGGRVFSYTGLFSMETPIKTYSSTGLFSTNETRMYGKWGRRLLTGAALLGGAALANHALGDPWGVGAKATDLAKGAWHGVRDAWNGNGTAPDATPTTNTTPAPTQNTAAPAENTSDSNAEMESKWMDWISRAKGEIGMWESTYKSKIHPDTDWHSSQDRVPHADTSNNRLIGSDVYKQRVDALIQEADSMQKPPTNYDPSIKTKVIFAGKFRTKDSLPRVFYQTLTKLKQISAEISKAWNEVNNRVAAQASHEQGMKEQDAFFMKNLFPHYQLTLQAYISKIQEYVSGPTPLSQPTIAKILSILEREKNKVSQKRQELEHDGYGNAVSRMKELEASYDNLRTQLMQNHH